MTMVDSLVFVVYVSYDKIVYDYDCDVVYSELMGIPKLLWRWWTTCGKYALIYIAWAERDAEEGAQGDQGR